MVEIEMEKNVGSGKLVKLSLISAGIFVFLWLFWGFVTLRDSPCGWINRLKGSECIRIILRRTDYNSGDVFFSADNSDIIFLDRGVIRIEPIRRRTLFSAAAEIPIFSFENISDPNLNNISQIDDFKVDTSRRKAVICIVHRTGEFDFEGIAWFKDLGDSRSAVSIFKGVLCDWENVGFVPNSSLLSVDINEGKHDKILFIDANGEIVMTVAGYHTWGYHDSSDVLPVIEHPSNISLYSFPEFEQLGRIEFPFDISRAKISQNGEYVVVSNSKKAELHVMNLTDREIVHTLANPDFRFVEDFVISPDSKTVAVIFEDSKDDTTFDARASLYLWDLKTGEVVKKIRLESQSPFTKSLDISPDGKLVAVGTPRYVMIFDITK